MLFESRAISDMAEANLTSDSFTRDTATEHCRGCRMGLRTQDTEPSLLSSGSDRQTGLIFDKLLKFLQPMRDF